jgi:hypothetical protein
LRSIADWAGVRSRHSAHSAAGHAGIDTDMPAGVEVPKAPPAEVAARLLDGLAADQEDIFPDANAEAMSTLWRSDPKAVERALAGAAA